LAQLELGKMYMRGNGVIQDQVQAHMWFSVAAAKGNGRALEIRDALAKSMTPAQIAEAQRLTRDCAKSNYKECG